MKSLYRLLSTYVYGEEGMAEKIYTSLLEGARSDAYVEVEPDLEGKKRYGEHYNPWDEPTFSQSLLLWPLAYAYTILADEYDVEDEGLSEIRSWGDRILASSDTDKVQWVSRTGYLKGVDRAGGKAAAYSIWGNATGNEDALTRGYYYFRHVMQTIGKGGQDLYWHTDQEVLEMGIAIKASSATIGPALYAATALHRSGVTDVFDYAPKGGNIKEGSSWVIEKAFARKDPITRQPTKPFGGLAWVELFIVLFPDHPVSKMADEKLPRRFGGLEGWETGGGPATCFYRDLGSAGEYIRTPTSSDPSKPKPYCLNKETNTTYKNPGNCEAGDEGISFKERASWKRENTSTSPQAGGKKTHCYNPDANILTESRICQKKYRVTLEEGEALVKQGN